MVVHVVALTVTGGAVTGPVSLRKPATFAETSWLLCWSVALTFPWLRLGRVRRTVVAVAVLAFGIGETSILRSRRGEVCLATTTSPRRSTRS
jgi:hypothetical protein